MKKTLLFIYFILFLSQICLGQDEVQPEPIRIRKAAVSLVPQSFFISGIEAAVERMIGPKGSIKVYGGYYTAEDHYLYERAASMTGYKLEFQPRLYIDGDVRGLDGFFFAASVNYRSIFLDDYKKDGITTDIDAKALGIGFIFGQQVISPSGFSFEWFIGGNLISPLNEYDTEKVHLSLINPYKRGIVPKAGISLGYAF